MNNKTKTETPSTTQVDLGTAVFAFSIGLLVMLIFFSYSYHWSDYNDIVEFGKNQTMSNQTFINQTIQSYLANNSQDIANNVNLYYINQYNAIPIYVKDNLKIRVFTCNNFSEVKQ